MFEHQYKIKDKTALKNALLKKAGEGVSVDINNDSIIISNYKKKVLFAGEIKESPMGCKIVGEFPTQKPVNIVASVVVALYIVFLLITYAVGEALNNYQIFLMIIALVFIVALRRVSDNRIAPAKNILENAE